MGTVHIDWQQIVGITCQQDPQVKTAVGTPVSSIRSGNLGRKFGESALENLDTLLRGRAAGVL